MIRPIQLHAPRAPEPLKFAQPKGRETLATVAVFKLARVSPPADPQAGEASGPMRPVGKDVGLN